MARAFSAQARHRDVTLPCLPAFNVRWRDAGFLASRDQSSHNAARTGAGVSFCRVPRRASGNSFLTASLHGSRRKFGSTRVKMNSPMSSKLLKVRAPPRALAFNVQIDLQPCDANPRRFGIVVR